MTIEHARRIVQQARGTDAALVEVRDVTTAITVLRDHASSLYDETQRESARWLAATADRPFRTLLELTLPLPLSEALSLMQFVETDPAQVRDVSSLIRSAGMLLEWIDAMYDGLTHDIARWASAPTHIQRRRVEGHVLERRDEGGRHVHLLSGLAVHEGTTLWLLTSAGWMAGIYYTKAGEPYFTFRLPGAAEHPLQIPIPLRARLAWSVE